MIPVDQTTIFQRLYWIKIVSEDGGLDSSEATKWGDSQIGIGKEDKVGETRSPIGEEEVPMVISGKEVSTCEN